MTLTSKRSHMIDLGIALVGLALLAAAWALRAPIVSIVMGGAGIIAVSVALFRMRALWRSISEKPNTDPRKLYASTTSSEKKT